MFICRRVEGNLHQQAFQLNAVLPPAEVVLPPKSRTALRLESEEAKRAAERAERERRCQLALSEIKRKQQLARERAAKQVHAYMVCRLVTATMSTRSCGLKQLLSREPGMYREFPVREATGKGMGSHALA